MLRFCLKKQLTYNNKRPHLDIGNFSPEEILQSKDQLNTKILEEPFSKTNYIFRPI